MEHETSLIGTIVVGIGVAFLIGALAHRLRISPIAGYLLAGVIVGPFTPGFVADTGLALQLAEIGVILLMFGVGLHFSMKDLLSVRRIALPGAIIQISVATAMGVGLGLVLGWSLVGALIFGLSLSVASTVVLIRALQARDIVETEKGRIAVGWLVVEDLAMVFTLLLIPAMIGSLGGEGGAAGWTRSAVLVFLKILGFAVFMLIAARRILPWVLHWTAHSGSRELFRLSVLAIALGVAFGAAVIFDVSFALGAFFAGMILGETQLSRRAAEETLPLRDAFAVLFFVSVGMLFDPRVLIEQPLSVAATVAIIVFGKTFAAYAIVRLSGYNKETALTISVSLAQIGEFSFILAGLGVALGVMPDSARDLILAGAILSILLNPILFALVSRLHWPEDEQEDGAIEEYIPPPQPDRTILIGYGHVGKHVAKLVRERGETLILIEDQNDIAAEAMAAGITVVIGNAAAENVLRQAGIDGAKTLLIAIPSAVKVFNWLSTIFKGNIRFNSANLFAIGFVSMFISGGLTGLFMGNSVLDIQIHDTYFIVAHFHLVMGVAAIFGMLSGIYHWYPKMFGRFMNETLGQMHFWGTIISAYMVFWPMHYLGMFGVPRRYYSFDTFDAFKDFDGLNAFITVGAIIGFLVQFLFIVNFFYSMWRGRKVTTKNPYKANTLEWTTPIDAPHGNWPGKIPSVERWAYDYSKDGHEYMPQVIPLREGEEAH